MSLGKTLKIIAVMLIGDVSSEIAFYLSDDIKMCDVLRVFVCDIYFIDFWWYVCVRHSFLLHTIL